MEEDNRDRFRLCRTQINLQAVKKTLVFNKQNVNDVVMHYSNEGVRPLFHKYWRRNMRVFF